MQVKTFRLNIVLQLYKSVSERCCINPHKPVLTKDEEIYLASCSVLQKTEQWLPSLFKTLHLALRTYGIQIQDLKVDMSFFRQRRIQTAPSINTIQIHSQLPIHSQSFLRQFMFTCLCS